MEREDILLAEIPALGGLYATGARQSVRLTRQQRREGHVGDLPHVVHEVAGAEFDAGQLSAYQHLLGIEARDAAPAGFVHIAAFPVATSVMVREDFPLPLLGMVHISNRVEQFAPVVLGEKFGVRAWAQDLRPHRRGALVDVVSEVRVADEPRWRGTSTYLAKGVSVPFAAHGGAAEDAAESDERAEITLPRQSGLWKLSASIGREYGAVSGDRNPIHLSALSAKALGFPRAIAHGMYTAARALAVIDPVHSVGEQFVWTIDFAKPVFLPGTVAFGSEPLADGAGWRYAGCHPKKGKLHFSGQVTSS